MSMLHDDSKLPPSKSDSKSEKIPLRDRQNDAGNVNTVGQEAKTKKTLVLFKIVGRKILYPLGNKARG